jgi:septal ring-binding cell division protein DamX
MAMPGTNYAVQVYASKTTDSVERFINDKGLNGMKMVRTDRSGSIVYVLVDIYPDRATANAAAVDLETKIGAKPWVRSVAGLQKIVAQ